MVGFRSAPLLITCRKRMASLSERDEPTAAPIWLFSRRKKRRRNVWCLPVRPRYRAACPDVEKTAVSKSSRPPRRATRAHLDERRQSAYRGFASGGSEDRRVQSGLSSAKQFPGEDFSVVYVCAVEEGLVIAPGNPKQVRKIEDLARKNVKFVNREPGSGSRALLDRLLEARA